MVVYQHPVRFTQSDIDEMRRLPESGSRVKDIAEQFGCNQSHVSRVTRGKGW